MDKRIGGQKTALQMAAVFGIFLCLGFALLIATLGTSNTVLGYPAPSNYDNPSGIYGGTLTATSTRAPSNTRTPSHTPCDPACTATPTRTPSPTRTPCIPECTATNTRVPTNTRTVTGTPPTATNTPFGGRARGLRVGRGRGIRNSGG